MTALNIFLIAKKSPPHVDPAILDSAPRLLMALVLIFDMWSFLLSFDCRVMPRFIAKVVP